jgi:hypothetical protein
MSNIITTLLTALIAISTALGQTIALPQLMAGHQKTSPQSAIRTTMRANSNCLFKHIAKFDKLFAHLFYWSIITVGLTLLLIALLDVLGLFNYIGWL